ncbi:MAG: hypothetical protein HC794_02970 [Nitrospiraceae bacterium]|nr:hypothetical protein [Nitrospiraceae bacterium]
MVPTIQWARRVRRGLQAALVVAAGALSVQAQAYTVSLLPAVQTVGVGATVAMDVMLSDLGSQGTGSYDFALGFDNSVLGFDRAEDGLSLGFAQGLGAVLSGNTVRVSDFSFDDPQQLVSLQAGTLRLFTLYFNAVGAGSSLVSVMSGNIFDVNGTAVSFGSNAASVIVSPATTNPVPLPGTLPLVLAALAAAAAMKRRQSLA